MSKSEKKGNLPKKNPCKTHTGFLIPPSCNRSHLYMTGLIQVSVAPYNTKFWHRLWENWSTLLLSKQTFFSPYYSTETRRLLSRKLSGLALPPYKNHKSCQLHHCDPKHFYHYNHAISSFQHKFSRNRCCCCCCFIICLTANKSNAASFFTSISTISKLFYGERCNNMVDLNPNI